MAAQANGHGPPLLRTPSVKVRNRFGRRRELARRVERNLKLAAGEVSRLAAPVEGQAWLLPSVALARDAVAWDTRHGKNVAAIATLFRCSRARAARYARSTCAGTPLLPIGPRPRARSSMRHG